MSELAELGSNATSQSAPLSTPGAATANWYAVYTCARHEKCVAKQLQDRKLEKFLPLYRRVHRWKDRSKLVELALFPSYVFVRITPAERLRVLQVPGVVRLVSLHGEPVPIPEQEINALRKGLDQQMCVEPHAYLHAGRRARVVHGPLTGAEGVLVQIKGRFRVVITLDVLMRSVAVEVDASDIEGLF